MPLRLSFSAGLRPTATAHLAQTMSLLALSNAELEEKVRAELDNPALEVVDEHRCRTCGRPIPRRGLCPLCADRGASDAPIVYLTPRGWEMGAGGAAPEADQLDPTIAAPEKLAEHLLRQIAPELALEERPLAAHIIFCLDDDGLLPEPAAEIALRLRVPLDRVRQVIALLQRADPPGVGASSVQESLLIQLQILAEQTENHAPDARALLSLASSIVAHHFKLLGRHEYASLARLLGASPSSVQAAAIFIRRNLTPYPARAFWGSGRGLAGAAANGRYYHPDISIHHHPTRPDGPLVVEITTPTAGWLRVNPAFKQALQACPEEERSQWEQYYERALLYTKCLQQRNNTMRRLMESIVATQRQFILQGDRHLQPMTRAALAMHLQVHESTISRAVSGKTAALPCGRIIPLSKFFDRSLPVREVIKDLIAGEPACAPLTDEAIVGRLELRGIQIARRTVAKYRTAEGILPAAMRNRLTPLPPPP